MLTDKYPPNPDYEYVLDDIILIINGYLVKAGYQFQHAIDEKKKFNTLMNADGLTVDEKTLPCYSVNKGKPLLYNKHKVILCGDLQSFDFSNTLNSLIPKMLAKKELYVCIFPLHLDFSSTGQGGHWNIAALFIDGKTKKAELWNIEPLGEKGQIENNLVITNDTFYRRLQTALKDFKLDQKTIQTAQQTDIKLCGAIAAENANNFWGTNNIFDIKYTKDVALELRKKHINLSNAENFAKRQFENWVFQGYKNDDYEAADGNGIWYALRKLQLENSDEYAADFSLLLKRINKEWESVEAKKIKQWLITFFKKYEESLLKIKINDKSIIHKFFKNTDYAELANAYNVIEVIKCLAKQFEMPPEEPPPPANSVGETTRSYKRNQGYSNTYRGDEYQKLVGMHFALKVYLSGIKKFKILTESAEKAYDFGKFDDLIIETDKQFEVLQVKHAGSTDESKRVYTVDILSATTNSKKEDIKKKAAFHIYYDAWRSCKDKKKPIVFRFYTNHQLDDNLKKFYDIESECYLGLLKPQSDPALKINQRKLIDSIYSGSEYFTKKIANNLLGNLKFITKGLVEANWKNFIEANHDTILQLLKNSSHFNKPKNCNIDTYQKIAFLLIGHFGLTASEDKIEIAVPNDYFTRNLKLTPIHDYLYKKLVISYGKKPKLITGNTITFTKNFAAQDELIKIIFPQKTNKTTITFPTKKSAEIFINDTHATWCVSLIFGIPTAEISYNPGTYQLNDQLLGKLLAEPNLPKDEFTDLASLDPSIDEFIKAFKFQIKQPSIIELEKQNFEHIRQRFQVEDHTYYLLFERYFLENFRAPVGKEITFATLDKVFQEAKLAIQKSRLVGYVERYIKDFKADKPNVVSSQQLKSIDHIYRRSDNIITIISGKPRIGKSYTILAWIEKYREEHKLLQDSYAFLPIRDVWDTDVELFINKLQLLAIDNVEEIFENTAKQLMLENLIYAAKKHRKKIVLIVTEHKKMELAVMFNGIPHHIVDCQPLTDAQIYDFAKITANHFVVIGNLFVKLDDLFTKQNNSGLAMALQNPGLLQNFLNEGYIKSKKIANKSDKPNEIVIQQNSLVNKEVDFYKFIKQAQGSILIFDPKGEKAFPKNLEEHSIKQIDINESEWPEPKAGKRIAVFCKEANTLSHIQLKNLKERNDMLIITSSEKLFQSLAKFIQHQCYAPNNADHCQVIKTTLFISTELWIARDSPKDYFSVCQMKELFAKHILVSVNAGMGKSTLVKRLCQTESLRPLDAEHYHWYIPIYLDQLTASDNQKSFSQFVFSILQRIYQLPDFFHTVIEQDLKQGNVLLVLDGGDQIKEEQLTECHELYHELISYAHVVFLTRPTQSRIAFNANQELILQPFTDEQIKEYFRKAFPKPEANPFFDAANQFMQENNLLREMLGVPLQCYLFWQAWLPYYEQWRQNNGEVVLPEYIKGDTALIAIFQRYLEAKFYIHFKRNLKIKGSLLEVCERINTLSMGYIDRFAHVSAWDHFSDIRAFLQTVIPKPIPQEWLDKDIEEIALIKRIAAPQHGSVIYVMAHRTYQEYAAAKFFVEGIMGLRQMHPKQKKWCKELLSIARFIHVYQQFWRFVLNWIQYHVLLNNLPPETLNNFEKYFKQNDDLIQSRENDFWEYLISNKNDFPPSYKPESIPQQKKPQASKPNPQTENFVEAQIKAYDDSQTLKKIIREYKGEMYTRHDSDIYRAIKDLPNHNNISAQDKLELLQHAYAPHKKVHHSYRVHEAIAHSLYQLNDANQEACKLLFSYYSQEFQDSDIFHVTRMTVLQAAKKIAVNKENRAEFLQLLKNLQTVKNAFNIDILEVVNHVFMSIFNAKLESNNDTLYKQFESFLYKLANSGDNIAMNKRNYIAIQGFIKNLDNFGNELTTKYIHSFKNLELAIMLIYAQYGDRLFPKKAAKEDSQVITKIIIGIPKDKIVAIVQFMTNKGYDTFPLLKVWLGIESKDSFNSLQNYHSQLQEIQKLIKKPDALKANRPLYDEIDGAIPAACELQKGFNLLSAAYIVKLMNKQYWQYPIALVDNIPRLLKYHINNGIYPHLVLYVYQECLKKLVMPDQYNDLFEHFFNNKYVNAYIAMDYAWQVYTNTGSEKAASVISTWTTHLQWPLFKASQALGLHLVTPGTGHVREFKAKDDTQLRSAMAFFKRKKEERIQNGECLSNCVTQLQPNM